MTLSRPLSRPERAGTASIFMFCEPLAGWRQVTVRERRTKVDWAQEMEALLGNRYASAEKVILVCDNLNTHTKGAFYEAFEPAKATALVRRLEFCHTPKHGSWLNIAENELSSMTRQCVTGRRFATIEELGNETTPWHEHSNARQRTVDWQFKMDDARVKLKSIYPKLEV
ncbi:transposase [Singulisphaera rosea]